MDFYSEPEHSRTIDLTIKGQLFQAERSRIQHFYHWATLHKAGIRPQSLDYIFEFGGGVGHIPKLVKQLGFTGAYTIYDFPELSKIQSYYNANSIETISGHSSLEELDVPEGKSLFYSTWAFSEAPQETRKAMEKHFRKFDTIFILYQRRHADIDNKEYFEEEAGMVSSKFTEGFPEINWTTADHPSLWDVGSRFLIGSKS